MVILTLFLIAGFLGPSACDDLELLAEISQHGVTGEVRFRQYSENDAAVKVDLKVSEGAEGDYTWGIYEFPIDYTEEDYCHSRYLGRRPRINLEELAGKLTLPSEDSIVKKLENVTLLGPDSIWGTSLVIMGPGRERICAAILPAGSIAKVRVHEARFTSPVAGSVHFHSLTVNGSTEVKLFTNLYHVVQGSTTSHGWQIYITDILGNNKRRESCNFLQILYDPDSKNAEGCSEKNPEKCKEGDLTGKFGKVKVAKQENMFSKSYLNDLNMELPDLSDGGRVLYLTLYDETKEDNFFACAEIHELKPKVALSKFRHDGIRGHISFTQASKFHPVLVDIDLAGLSGEAGSYHIHEFPVPPRRTPDDAPCGATGAHYNPFGVDKSTSPEAGGSSDKYEVGDLSGKYGDLRNKTELSGRFTDPSLSLFGSRSVIGRSIVIHHSPKPVRWVCANIELKDSDIITAVANFVYPIAGRIVFRQDVKNPLADTSIYVEGLLYSDGSKNASEGHKWHIHEDVPGKDFFNWTGRCLSAGKHFNPYHITSDESVYKNCLNTKSPSRCEVGDLENKHSNLAVAGRRIDLTSTRRFFTDSNLPLMGGAGIIGRSVVLHDDHAPEHRGNRMGVAREWFGNGIPSPVDGRLEFIQDTGSSETATLVELDGLEQFADGYHVHDIPVQPHLEFACSADAVGGHFNPWGIDKSISPAPAEGTPDQYEVGDLSGKYGSLKDRFALKGIFNDTNLPMFGSQSIVGRSVVIHKAYKGQRWACSTIGWGWDPDEARQVSAIASFHHPNGFAWGYIRFTQVVYNDGSSTDTIIEMRLKYPGKTNQQFTRGHAWSVYVNPVGHDASVKFERARCSAAGYRWNPTFIQLADPNDHGFYEEECSPETPLRCEVGDLSGRHGRIDIGGHAYVFNDNNLPLHGDWYNSALGKSIVIHGPDGAGHSMACANIEPDKDIIKYIVVKSGNGFNLGQFMEDVQGVLGVPEWYLFTDARETKLLHEGRCLQVLLHFRGPHANKIEQDFSRLLRTGRMDTPSLQIPGYVPPVERKTELGYRECSSRGINNRNPNYSDYENSSSHLRSNGVVISVIIVAIYSLAL